MIYYISASGSTSNTGTSAASPWPISKFTSFAFLQDDVIGFKKGDTFPGNLSFARSGAAGHNIKITTYGTGNNPVFDNGAASSRVLAILGAYIDIDSLILQNANNDALYISNTHDVSVTNCYGNNVLTFINTIDCFGGIKINANWARNMKGPKPKGQFVQFNNNNGPGSQITNNNLWNEQGLSNPEDAISLYESNGTSSSPILVDNNKILGGGPSGSGGGIMSGDSGGSWQTVSNNILVNPGQYGIAISGGLNSTTNCGISIINNKVFGAKAAWTNVGLYVWSQKGDAPSIPNIHGTTVSGNRVKFTDAAGNNNGVWLASGEETPAGWGTNNFSDSTINAGMLPNPLWTGTPWNSSSPAPLAFPAIPAKLYGAANFNPGATSGLSITYSSANPSVATIIAGNIHIVGVGTSVITATDGLTSINQTLTVNKVALQVTANAKTKLYGAAVPALTLSITGFVLGENSTNLSSQPVAATTGSSSSTAGNYPITVSGGSSGNYAFNYISGVLTVSKAPLTVTADNKTKAQGTANPALTTSYSGFVNGDTILNLTIQPVLSTTAISSSPAGPYPINITGGPTDQNYIITYVNGTMTITAGMLVFPPIPGKTYGALDFSANVTSVLPVTLSSDNTAVATIVSGNIHIVGAGIANITASNGSSSQTQQLVVLKVNLTIQADNHTIFIGDPLPALTVSYIGFVLNETEANLATPPSLSTTASSGSPVGAYPISVSGAVSGNYNMIYIAGTLSIVNEGFIHFKRRIRFAT